MVGNTVGVSPTYEFLSTQTCNNKSRKNIFACGHGCEEHNMWTGHNCLGARHGINCVSFTFYEHIANMVLITQNIFQKSQRWFERCARLHYNVQEISYSQSLCSFTSVLNLRSIRSSCIISIRVATKDFC